MRLNFPRSLWTIIHKQMCSSIFVTLKCIVRDTHIPVEWVSVFHTHYNTPVGPSFQACLSKQYYYWWYGNSKQRVRIKLHLISIHLTIRCRHTQANNKLLTSLPMTSIVSMGEGRLKSSTLSHSLVLPPRLKHSYAMSWQNPPSLTHKHNQSLPPPKILMANTLRG